MSHTKKSLDLNKFVPSKMKNSTNETLIKNLYNKFLSKDESIPLLGYIGNKLSGQDDSYLGQPDSDRFLNALQPMMYTKHGAEEHVFTFLDTLHRLKLLNVDLEDFGTWGQALSFNMMFPINIDKFINYSKYYWYGHVSLVTPPSYNLNMNPEYIIINNAGSTAWSQENLWLHEDDVDSAGYNISDLIQGIRPILEYSSDLELNDCVSSIDGSPTAPGNGISYTQTKSEFGQYPLFNLYEADSSTHAGKVSSILYYEEGNIYPFDETLNKRIAIDAFGDYTFAHGLTAAESGKFFLYKEGTEYKSCWTRSSVYQPEYVKEVNGEAVATSTNDPTGTWLVPDQITKNIEHDANKFIKFGDLIEHFVSIISEQNGFIGNPFGKNNFRNLPMIDLGLGGKIKDFNTSFDLFFSLINQPDTTPLSIIDFANSQYQQSLTYINEYIVQNLAYLIVDSEIKIDQNIELTYQTLYEKFLEVLPTKYANNIFSDSTSINGWPATLPYLGLSDKVLPELIFDKITGLNSILHHDGHISESVEYDLDILVKIADISFERSDGSFSTGLINDLPPTIPYRKQFWLDTNNNELRVFNVNSDAAPIYPLLDGDYIYDRGLDQLYQWDEFNSAMIPIANKAVAWQVVNVADIINNVTLKIELDLYNNVPNIDPRINLNNVINHTRFDELMEINFANYAADRNIDLYTPDYIPSDAFTWNYGSAIIPGVNAGTTRWYDIYEQYFGTQRPNLEPWILSGYTEEPSWWLSEYFDVSQTSLWIDQMWIDIKNGDAPAGQPTKIPPSGAWTGKLSVDPITDELLPPYHATNLEALLSTIPNNINASYSFNDNGPAEILWKNSIYYKYDIIKTAFIIDPINFINDTWGHHLISIDDFQIDSLYNKKVNHNDIILHGESIEPDDFELNGLFIIPSANYQTYTLEVKSHSSLGTLINVSGSKSGRFDDALVNTYYNSGDLSFTFNKISSEDLEIGDKFIIDYSDTGTTITKIPIEIKLVNGLNQWFVNLNRYNGVDLKISLNNNILRDWKIQLGYRASGLLDTDNLSVKTDEINLNTLTDINVVLKRNRGLTDFWLNGFRIQLIRKGTTLTKSEYLGRNVSGSQKLPTNVGDYAQGADWEYRVEIANTKNPIVTYYELDTNGPYKTFNALSKENSTDEWKKYSDVLGEVTKIAPFTLVGIQSVIDFLFGYVRKSEDDGWLFNQDNQSRIDSNTGRTKNWQFEIEKFIDKQYLGINAGTAVVVNPFTNKVWFKTPHGLVSTLQNTSYNDPYITQTVFNVVGKNLPEDKLKVLRQDDITEISTGTPMHGVHIVLDENEHVLLFNNYIEGLNTRYLIYDSFLGIRVNRMHIITKAQEEFDGKLSFGGHYIHNKKVRKNIEGGIKELINLYDINEMNQNSKATQAARALLGYEGRNECMENLGLPDKSQFGFWRGLINNKGSNLSIDAFLNSARFKSAALDEYWAYKIADYGDSRYHNYPEIKLNVNETDHKHLSLQFLESTDNEPDVGFIGITPFDEDRWFTLNDLNTELYFNAELLDKLIITVNTPFNSSDFYDLQTQKPLISDYIEAKNLTSPNSSVIIQQINHNTIKFTSGVSSGDSIEVSCYGPSNPKFNPSKLIDYQNRVIVSELPLWDPARGAHSSEGISIVNMISSKDPAKYNYSTRTSNNENYLPLKSWSSLEVGTVWWDTSNLSYIPYSDVNLFPNLTDRLTYWGSLSQYSSIDLYEWTESTVHPSEWADLVLEQEGDADIDVNDKATGSASLRELYSRTRTWQQRPLPWKYSDIPGNPGNFINENAINTITLETSSIGKQLAIVDDVKWSDLNYETNMKISSWDGTTPVGEALIIAEDEITFINQTAVTTTNFTFIILTSSLDFPNVIGDIIFDEDPSNAGYLRATAVSATNTISQSIIVTDATTFDFDFGDIGIRIIGNTSNVVTISDILIEYALVNDVTIKSAINVDVINNFGTNTLTSWISWNDPTDFISDLEAPNNRWTPITTGIFTDITNVAYLVDFIQNDIDNPFTSVSGNNIEKFKYIWSNWSINNDFFLDIKYIGASNIDLGQDAENVEVYKNGFLQNNNLYSISGNFVDITLTDPNDGDLYRFLIRKVEPTNTELEFDPTILDDPTILIQYKYDYQYTTREIQEENGRQAQTLYYFWVSDKNITTRDRDISLTQAKDALEFLNTPYSILQNIRVGSNNLPIRYTQFITNGLNRFVTKDDTYKLRFTRDFILRDDPKDINLKNIHSEWTLIRQNQKQKIPAKLWDRLVDTVCGSDPIGNAIPSNERVEYDEKYGTNTRFGSEPGQAFVDSDLAKTSIIFTILNTQVQIVNYALNEELVPDYIDFLDFSEANQWFVTSESSREILTQIWDNAKPEQINEIFFAVFFDALSKNYEFADIMKTSMVSVHSIRLLDN